LDDAGRSSLGEVAIMSKVRLVVVAAVLFAAGSGIGSAGCGPVPPGGTGGAGGTGGVDPYGPYREGFTPLPTNAKECPPGAPANPIGSCVGLPIYLGCGYTNGTVQYNCVCDWVHWLCL
jgi:hypothetical protein